MRATLSFLALLGVCAGCSFDTSIHPDVTLIDCKRDADCPAGYRCEPAEGAGDVSQCRLLDATVTVEGPFGLSPFVTEGPLTAVYTFTFRSDVRPITRGTVWAEGEQGEQIDFDAERQTDGGFVVHGNVTSALRDGRYTLKSYFYDDTGAGARGEAWAFIVDKTAPDLSDEETLVFTPAPGSAGARYFLPITALGPGGKVRVSFRANEPVTGTVYATDDAGTRLSQVVFTGDIPDGGLQNLTFEGVLLDGGNAPALEAHLWAELRDRAGNVAAARLSKRLVVDAQPPVLDTSGTRTFFTVHAPFGAADGGPKGTTLHVEGRQLPEDGTLLVLDQGTGSVALLEPVTAGVGLEHLLLSAGPSYEVVLIDRAGSGSVPQPVRDGTLVYRPHGIAAGVQDGRMLEAWAAMIGSRHAQLQSAASFPVDIESRGRWRQAGDAVRVPTNASMACDADRGRMIRFGGTLRGIPTADTYAWQGDGWRKVGGTSALPEATASEAKLAYDPQGQQTVMFHGPSGQTWTWKNDRWTQRQSARHPPERVEFSMTFDEHSGQMLLFGGARPDGGPTLSDTWEWNGIDWTPWDGGVGPSPKARRNAAMTYDPGSQRVLLYGGTGAGSASDEVWVYGGAPTRSWRQVTVEPGDRPAGAAPMMMYDVRRALVRVVAVENGGLTSYELQYDGGSAAWIHDFDAAVPAGSAPFEVLTGAYDSARAEVFVTDGLWRFQLPAARNWRVTYAADELLPRAGPAMAWDPASQQVLMFGGTNGVGSAADNNETWGFRSDGGWRRISTSAPPGPRHSAVLLSVDGGLLLAGGRTGNVSMIGGTVMSSHLLAIQSDGGGAWVPVPTGFVGSTTGASNGYEAVLWGKDAGYYSSGDVQAATTNSLLAGDMVFDPFSNRIISFNGSRTWTSYALSPGYSPAQFDLTELFPLSRPPLRSQPTVFYDGALLRVMTFGGLGAPIDRRVWGYEGNSWVEQPVADLEGDGLPDVYGPISYEATTDTAVMWGNATAQTWTLRYAGQRPAVVFHNVLSTQLNATSLDGVELLRITATAIAGGDARLAGAQLMIWNQGRWEALGTRISNTASTSAPSLASLTIPDRGTVEQILRGHSELSIAVTTVGGHGTSPAALTVRDLVVTLDYRYAVEGARP